MFETYHVHLFIDHKPISMLILEGQINTQAVPSFPLSGIKNFSAIHPNNGTTQKMMEIKAFLEVNHRFHYSYDHIAAKFGINTFKLKKEFKAVTGYNIHEYVTRVRIEQAQVYLENTTKTISDIAHKIGLDKSNFIKQFKNYTGQTPTAWRKHTWFKDDCITEHKP